MDIIGILGNIGLALGGLALAAQVFIKAVRPLTRLTPSTLDDEALDYAERMLEGALAHVRAQRKK